MNSKENFTEAIKEPIALTSNQLRFTDFTSAARDPSVQRLARRIFNNSKIPESLRPITQRKTYKNILDEAENLFNSFVTADGLIQQESRDSTLQDFCQKTDFDQKTALEVILENKSQVLDRIGKLAVFALKLMENGCLEIEYLRDKRPKVFKIDLEEIANIGFMMNLRHLANTYKFTKKVPAKGTRDPLGQTYKTEG